MTSDVVFKPGFDLGTFGFGLVSGVDVREAD